MIKHFVKLLIITLLLLPHTVEAADVQIAKEIKADPWLLNITSVRYGLDRITYLGDAGFSTSQKQFKKNTQFMIIKAELKSNGQKSANDMDMKCNLIVNSKEKIGVSYVKMKDNRGKQYVGDFSLNDVSEDQFPIEVSLYFMQVPLSMDTISLSVNGNDPVFITSIREDLQRRIKIIENHGSEGSK